jgi:hypothetical protein
VAETLTQECMGQINVLDSKRVALTELGTRSASSCWIWRRAKTICFKPPQNIADADSVKRLSQQRKEPLWLRSKLSLGVGGYL